MAIGVPLKEIYHTTLCELSAYNEAQRLKDEVKDMWCWYMGAYVHEAMSVTLANAFSSKGSTPIKYRDKPFLKDVQTELTEEDIKAQRQAILSSLTVMQHNFERTHGEK